MLRCLISVSSLLIVLLSFEAHAQSLCTIEHAKSTASVAGLTIRPIEDLQSSIKVPEGVLDVSSKGTSYCIVTGSVTTDKDAGSRANFAVALPTRWSNRFLFTGCGGYCGSVGLLSEDNARGSLTPTDALAKGYAVVATDDGHIASGGFSATWALQSDGMPNDAALSDFGERAVHLVAQRVRSFVQQWYGQPVQHAYFYGCSDGGRESMMEASRYPEDFDGFIAGAPFFDVPAEILSSHAAQVSAATPGSFIPASTLIAIDRTILSECDKEDGVQDGLIQNPAMCTVDLAKLTCKGGSSDSCVTAEQAHTLQSWLGSVRDTNGKLLAYGYAASDILAPSVPGANLGLWAGSLQQPTKVGGAEPWDESSVPPGWLFYNNSLRFIVFRDPTFDSNKHSIVSPSNRVSVQNYRLLAARTAFARSDDPRELDRLMNSKRKLIMFHGFSDGFINPYRTMSYYEDLSHLNGGYAQTSQHARLFMAPGVYHCGGGPGPNSFDTLSALERWVEQGIAPDQIMAHRDDGQTPAASRSMPLCPYPAQAHFSGNGDVNDGKNWTCTKNQDLLRSGQSGKLAGWH